MNLNSYLFPASFHGATIDELEQCFREINEVTSNDMHVPVSYLQTQKLYSVTMANGEAFVNVIYNLKDKQLSRNIVPKLMRLFKYHDKDYSELAEMYADFTSDINSFWGIHFDPKHTHCLTSKHELELHLANSLDSLMHPTRFEEISKILYPHVIISDDAMSQIISLGDSNDFRMVCADFKMLESYCETWREGSFRLKDLTDKYPITSSDESDSVKNNERLKSERLFKLKGLGTKYCLLHIKHGDFRIHYYPDDAKRQIHIGHVGPHLPL